MKKRILSIAAALLAMSLTGCQPEEAAVVAPTQEPVVESPSPSPTPTPSATPTPSPEPEPEPEPIRYPNPLTGEPMDVDTTNQRPVAIMLDNMKRALPQLGQSQADIIYECLAEGGITRMLGVFHDPSEADTIGGVRSSRPYYLEIALGHDALYLHAGGSEDAYANIRAWGVDSLDCVRGPYEGNSPESNLFWRDADRRANNGLEHSVVTNGAAISAHIPDSIPREHDDDFVYPQTFAEDGTPAEGEAANFISVPMSSYKTGTFAYDSASSTYLVGQYGEEYIDGNTGNQIAVTNVLVIETACVNTWDSLDHITVDLQGEGDAWYACGGKIVPIRWSKAGIYDPFVYTNLDGSPLVLGQGKSYVSVMPLENEVTFQA